MGLPQHYSIDLAERCLRLIDVLWPYAQETVVPGQEHLGPLTTTFLLALATPIITLPIERVERHRSQPGEGYVDDRSLDADVAKAVETVLGSNSFGSTPFFETKRWSYFELPYLPGINVARRLPEDAIQKLASDDAFEKAERMLTQQWASCLRNALAHGGIAYLDATGAQSHEAQAKMLVFVSAKYLERGKPPESLRFLRISEEAFRSFLYLWVVWLRTSRLKLELAA